MNELSNRVYLEWLICHQNVVDDTSFNLEMNSCLWLHWTILNQNSKLNSIREITSTTGLQHESEISV